jgi:Xaa-Pro aminopeptidase
MHPYAERRARLLETMQRGIAIIPTAQECIRNRDTHYAYRFDSYFYYLTGFTEADAVLVLVAGDHPQSILFCRDKDPEREVWDGFRFGPLAAREVFGFDAAFAIDLFDARLPELLADQPALYFALGIDRDWDSRVVAALNRVRGLARTGMRAPAAIMDVHAVLDEMRLFKDSDEIAAMRCAADISAAAHHRAMRAARAARNECEIEAELLHEFRRHGAQAPAYTPIVAGGANACILHYIENNQALRDGDLLLIDAACEYHGYAADITRTFPVNGRFSGPQRDAYELVLAAQSAAIAAVKPDSAWGAPHDAALKILAQGMIDLGMLSGSVDAVLESGSYKRFYMHRTGHWLGLDVHDAGEYKLDKEWRPLRAGMTLTVEPGLYIRPGDGVPEPLWNIGIRIEDDVLVTADGCEVLTAAARKQIADIEQWMADGGTR